MMKRQRPAPDANLKEANSFVCTVTVDDVDDIIARVKAAGGSVNVPANDVPEVGRLAYVRNSEGNMLGVLKPVDGGAGM